MTRLAFLATCTIVSGSLLLPTADPPAVVEPAACVAWIDEGGLEGGPPKDCVDTTGAGSCAAWLADGGEEDDCPEPVPTVVTTAEKTATDAQACAAWIPSEDEEEGGSGDACDEVAPGLAGLVKDVGGLRDVVTATVTATVDTARACADWLAGDREEGACPEPVQQEVEATEGCAAWLQDEDRDPEAEDCPEGVVMLVQLVGALQEAGTEALDTARACADWLAGDREEGACPEPVQQEVEATEGCAAWLQDEDRDPEAEDCEEDVRTAVTTAEETATDAQACAAWIQSEGAEGEREACGEDAAELVELVWDLRDQGVATVENAQACAAWIQDEEEGSSDACDEAVVALVQLVRQTVAETEACAAWLAAGDYGAEDEDCPEAVRDAVVVATEVQATLENHPPDPPGLLFPGSGSTHGVGEPEEFRVNATDPDGDPYTATIIVTARAGAQCSDGDEEVDRLETPLTPSGEETGSAPSAPLAAGAYCWTAFATDVRDVEGEEAEPQAFSIVEVEVEEEEESPSDETSPEDETSSDDSDTPADGPTTSSETVEPVTPSHPGELDAPMSAVSPDDRVLAAPPSARREPSAVLHVVDTTAGHDEDEGERGAGTAAPPDAATSTDRGVLPLALAVGFAVGASAAAFSIRWIGR